MPRPRRRACFSAVVNNRTKPTNPSCRRLVAGPCTAATTASFLAACSDTRFAGPSTGLPHCQRTTWSPVTASPDPGVHIALGTFIKTALDAQPRRSAGAGHRPAHPMRPPIWPPLRARGRPRSPRAATRVGNRDASLGGVLASSGGPRRVDRRRLRAPGGACCPLSVTASTAASRVLTGSLVGLARPSNVNFEVAARRPAWPHPRWRQGMRLRVAATVCGRRAWGLRPGGGRFH